jgi:hypothetical protein
VIKTYRNIHTIALRARKQTVYSIIQLSCLFGFFKLLAFFRLSSFRVAQLIHFSDPIAKFGTAAQKAEFVLDFASGKKLVRQSSALLLPSQNRARIRASADADAFARTCLDTARSGTGLHSPQVQQP